MEKPIECISVNHLHSGFATVERDLVVNAGHYSILRILCGEVLERVMTFSFTLTLLASRFLSPYSAASCSTLVRNFPIHSRSRSFVELIRVYVHTADIVAQSDATFLIPFLANPSCRISRAINLFVASLSRNIHDLVSPYGLYTAIDFCCRRDYLDVGKRSLQ